MVPLVGTWVMTKSLGSEQLSVATTSAVKSGTTASQLVSADLVIGWAHGEMVGACVSVTSRHWENSEVLELLSLAVAVTNSPTRSTLANGTLNVAPPLKSVVTLAEPRNVWPCPKPDGPQSALAK